MWTRTFYIYRAFLIPLVAVSAILGAVVVVRDSTESADQTLRWQRFEYPKLANIHAGYDSQYVESLLGTPTQTIDYGRYELALFQRRDHWVQILAPKGGGAVALYSVTSCQPDFQPTFDMGSALIQLQNAPVSAAITGDSTARDPADQFDSQTRLIDYIAGATASAPAHYFEWSGQGANANGIRAYFVGVNTQMCTSNLPDGLLPSRRYTGEEKSAPTKLKHFRTTVSANTYAETAYPPSLELSRETGDLVVGKFAVPVGVNYFPLPPDASQGEIRFSD